MSDTEKPVGGLRPRNIVASVSARLLTLAHAQNEEYQLVLMRYGLERLLYRLGQSPYVDQFIVKGALLFTLWAQQPERERSNSSAEDPPAGTDARLMRRATRDLDLLGFGSNDIERLQQIFYELIMSETDYNDGLTFLPESVQAALIRLEQRYGGVRVQLLARLGNARIPLQIDVGFGDVVTPSPVDVAFPTLLRDQPEPHVRVYPRETVVAEKFEALVSLGMPNTRLKDFYDLWILASRFSFTGQSLSAALRATFKRRGVIIPTEAPIALTARFGDDRAKRAQWAAFVGKGKLEPGETPDLTLILATLERFLMPPCRALALNETFGAMWPAGGPWGH